MPNEQITEVMKLTRDIKENTQCDTREALEAAKEFFELGDLEIYCMEV